MTDSTGSRTFKRAGIGVTSPVLSDGSASFTPSGENRAGVKTAYHGGLKSFDTQTNSAQAVVGQRLTDAFGNQISSSGVWKGRFAYGGPYRYQEDPDTGLRLLGHRYYDSSTGRFLTRDPIKDGRNWYVYCDNNPASTVDSDGLLARPVSGEDLAENARYWSNEGAPGYNSGMDDPQWAGGTRKEGNQLAYNKNNDCGVFVAFIIRLTMGLSEDDNSFPKSGVGKILEALESRSGKDGEYTAFDMDETYVPQPGDIIIATGGINDTSHAAIISEVRHGVPYVSQASLGNYTPLSKPFKHGAFLGKYKKVRVFRPKRDRSPMFQTEVNRLKGALRI